MPTDAAVLTSRAAFEAATDALVTAPPAATPPAPDDASVDTAPLESPTSEEAVVDGDALVESSIEAESTPADEPDESGTADDATSDTGNKPKGSRASERIQGLIAEREALKLQLEYLQKDVLAKLTPAAKSEPPPAVPPPATDTPPTLESVNYDTDKWAQAMTAWTNKQIQAGVTQAVQGMKQSQTEEQLLGKFNERMAAYEAKNPDFKTLLANPALPKIENRDVAAYVVASPLAPQILHYLGKHPDVAVRISRQTPLQQAASIGRIEAQITPPNPAGTAKKPATTITKAPPPPTPSGGGGASGMSRDITKMPIAEAMRLEREALIKRRQTPR
jgi:hypothetical protein